MRCAPSPARWTSSPTNVRQDPAANAAFLAMLTSRHDPERALRLMNEAGVLGRFIPEFGHAVGLMQFNMYHHYTVDEHLIRAVGNVASIERGEHKDDNPLSTEVIKRIKSRARALLRHPAARCRQGVAGRSQRCRRRDRPHPVPAAGPVGRRHQRRRLAGEEPSGDERHRPAPRRFRSQDGARFRGPWCSRRKCCGCSWC